MHALSCYSPISPKFLTWSSTQQWHLLGDYVNHLHDNWNSSCLYFCPHGHTNPVSLWLSTEQCWGVEISFNWQIWQFSFWSLESQNTPEDELVSSDFNILLSFWTLLWLINFWNLTAYVVGVFSWTHQWLKHKLPQSHSDKVTVARNVKCSYNKKPAAVRVTYLSMKSLQFFPSGIPLSVFNYL